MGSIVIPYHTALLYQVSTLKSL